MLRTPLPRALSSFIDCPARACLRLRQQCREWPRPPLTECEVGILKALKAELASFAVIQGLDVRFRLFPHHDESQIGDVKGCGVAAIVDFARPLICDTPAVANAAIEGWGNGQPKARAIAARGRSDRWSAAQT
jgi:hypothetical protein